MAIELPQNDPIAAYQRDVTAQRCVGENARCACGETRPEALIRSSNPIICAACKRRAVGEKLWTTIISRIEQTTR